MSMQTALIFALVVVSVCLAAPTTEKEATTTTQKNGSKPVSVEQKHVAIAEKTIEKDSAAADASTTTTTAKSEKKSSSASEKSASDEKSKEHNLKSNVVAVEMEHEPLNAHQKVSQLSESKDEPRETANSVGNKISDAAGTVKDGVADTANQIGDAASNAAKSASDTAKNAANDLKNASTSSMRAGWAFSMLSAAVLMAFTIAVKF